METKIKGEEKDQTVPKKEVIDGGLARILDRMNEIENQDDKLDEEYFPYAIREYTWIEFSKMQNVIQIIDLSTLKLRAKLQGQILLDYYQTVIDISRIIPADSNITIPCPVGGSLNVKDYKKTNTIPSGFSMTCTLKDFYFYIYISFDSKKKKIYGFFDPYRRVYAVGSIKSNQPIINCVYPKNGRMMNSSLNENDRIIIDSKLTSGTRSTNWLNLDDALRSLRIRLSRTSDPNYIHKILSLMLVLSYPHLLETEI